MLSVRIVNLTGENIVYESDIDSYSIYLIEIITPFVQYSNQLVCILYNHTVT